MFVTVQVANWPGDGAVRKRQYWGNHAFEDIVIFPPHRAGVKRPYCGPLEPEKDVFLFPAAVPPSRPAPYGVPRMATLLVGKVGVSMKAQLARFVISVIAMLIALIIFVEMDVGWLSAALIVVSLISGFSLSEAVFRHLADHETIRRDLEERVRNQHL
jgi:hypothetical protein